jgi:RsiW-degrading membrane proteinase PrsW (M82 family)
MTLLTIALAPVFILLVYVYFRDKYEKEPFSLLLKGLFAGAFITIPVIFTGWALSRMVVGFSGMQDAAWQSFIVAALTEESFKFMAVLLLFWRHREFNERFDGIVYAVFVSLGFAAVENIMYVYNSGMGTGFIRALTAVPAHALFGISMGYYTGMARFIPEQRRSLLFKAIFYPVLMHGLYNFILLSGHPLLLLVFIPYLIYLWRNGSKKLARLSQQSINDTEL